MNTATAVNDDLTPYELVTGFAGSCAAVLTTAGAERGVAVRVLVDDLLIDADDKSLLSMGNPAVRTGAGFLESVLPSAMRFGAGTQAGRDIDRATPGPNQPPSVETQADRDALLNQAVKDSGLLPGPLTDEQRKQASRQATHR